MRMVVTFLTLYMTLYLRFYTNFLVDTAHYFHYYFFQVARLYFDLNPDGSIFPPLLFLNLYQFALLYMIRISL